MFDINDIKRHFKLRVPIAYGGEHWNGRPDKWSNLPDWRLVYTQKFAMRPDIYKQFGLAGHDGLDIAGKMDSPIVAPIKMWPFRVDHSTGGYGKQVRAETDTLVLNGDHLKLELVFGHFNKIYISPHKWLDVSSVLGAMGNTGFVFGPTGIHLHFGVRPWVSPDGSSWRHLFKNNGFAGYIDPEQLLDIKLIWDYQNLMDEDKFFIEHDTKLVRNSKTGEFGWVYDSKIRTAKTTSRFSLMLSAALHREQGGITINDDFWKKLPKEKF